MKRTVKPSPVAVIFFGAAELFCIVISVAELADTLSISAVTIVLDFLVTGAFIFYLLKFLSQSKIYFDESSFTVDGQAYTFDEITDVTVKSEQVLRNASTLRITLFKGDEKICSFTKNDSGAKDFIILMKKHAVSVSIDV